MSANKVSVTDLHDFLQSREGWGLFLDALFAMKEFHDVIREDTTDRERALTEFETAASLVDFLNALLSKKAADANE